MNNKSLNPVENGKKTCSKCLTSKEVAHFRIRTFSNGIIRPIAHCKSCESNYFKTYERTNVIRGYKRSYRANFSNLISNSKKRAKARGIAHTITREDIKSLLESQDGKCALTGIPITFEPNPQYIGKRQAPPNRISIDRIDNSRGYTTDNIQLVCDFVNRFRNYIGLADFVRCCVLVAEKYKSDGLIDLQADMERNIEVPFGYLLTKK